MRRSNKPYLFLIVIFSLMILSVLPYWFLRGPNPYQRSWLEGRYLEDFQILNRGFKTALVELVRGNPENAKQLFSEQFVLMNFQADLESAAMDQFPFRYALIQSAKTIDRGLISAAYLFLPDPAIPADMRSEFFITRDRSAIMFSPTIYDQGVLQQIDSRIENYAALIGAYPDIHFNVYYIERLQNTPYHPLDSMSDNFERGRYYQYFIERIPPGLVVEKFDIDSYESYFENFYHTDHHWNTLGVLSAYQEIHAMLAKNYPEISEPKVYDDFITFDDIKFQGSEARKSFHSISEPFTVVDYDLGPYQVFENGQEVVYGGSTEYFNHHYVLDPYFNHYEAFYGGDRALLEFVFENTPDRNLLVIGNSYDNALLPLLASHYHHTYDVDLRYYPDFKMGDFLAEHPVDDVLIIGENSFAFSSQKYAVQP